MSQESKVIEAPRVMAFLVTLETPDQMVGGQQKYSFPCSSVVKKTISCLHHRPAWTSWKSV